MPRLTRSSTSRRACRRSCRRRRVGVHQLAALLVDHLALIVHHVVELEQVLADLEVARLDLLLRLLERLVDPGMDDRLALLQAEALQHAVHAVASRRCASDRPRSDRKNLEAPGSPWRPERPRSWLSMRRLSWRSVPMIKRPPAPATASCSRGHLGADLRRCAAPRGFPSSARPPSSSFTSASRRCRRAGCRCRGRPCWWRWSPRPGTPAWATIRPPARGSGR